MFIAHGSAASDATRFCSATACRKANSLYDSGLLQRPLSKMLALWILEPTELATTI